MQYNSKAKFATHLRKHSIPYTTSKEFIVIGHVYIQFNIKDKYVKFSDNRYHKIQFNTPYSHPQTLLYKYQTFKKMILNMMLGESVYNIPIHYN